MRLPNFAPLGALLAIVLVAASPAIAAPVSFASALTQAFGVDDVGTMPDDVPDFDFFTHAPRADWIGTHVKIEDLADGSSRATLIAASASPLDELDALMAWSQDPQTLTSTWHSDGLELTVTTPRKIDKWGHVEPASTWAARHRQAVDAARVAFPPDPTVGIVIDPDQPCIPPVWPPEATGRVRVLVA